MNKIGFNNLIKGYVSVYEHTDLVGKQMQVCGKKSRGRFIDDLDSKSVFHETGKKKKKNPQCMLEINE